MADIELLKSVMEESGMPKTLISKRSGIDRVVLYNRLAGKGDFTATEIVGLTKALKLSKTVRDKIFFSL